MQTAGTALPYWVEFVSALSPVAILISAIIAGFWARKNIRDNKDTSSEVARKRATLDVIIQLESDEYYQKISSTFRDVRDSRGLLSILDAKSNRDLNERSEVHSFLNHYEIICCGIRENALDEAFLHKWFKGSFIRHWQDSETYIIELRKINGNQKVFSEFQKVATCWDKNQFVTRKDNPIKLANGRDKTQK